MTTSIQASVIFYTQEETSNKKSPARLIKKPANLSKGWFNYGFKYF